MANITANMDGVGQAVKRKKEKQQQNHKNRMNTRRGIPLLLFCGLVALSCAIFVASKIEELKLLVSGYLVVVGHVFAYPTIIYKWGEDMSLHTKNGIYGAKNFSLAPAPNGVEDITSIFHVEGLGEIFIGTADNRMKLWNFKGGGAEHTEDGTLQSILVPVDPKGPIVVKPIKLYGRPKGVAFHPHGMYYLKETSELFVVNHAYGTEGELVEIFFIEHINGSPHAKATFKSNIHLPAPIQSLNDVVAISSDEIFITQWLHVGAPVHGNEGVMKHFRAMLNGLVMLILPIPSSLRPPIWRCVTSEKGTNRNSFHKKEWNCAPVPGTAGRTIMYNGIALSRNKKALMTADTVGRKILFFNREEGGQLRFKEEIKLPFHPDNIEPSPIREDGGELFTVGVVGFQESIEIMLAAQNVSSMEELTSTGKVSHGGAIEFSLPEGGYKQELLTFQNILHCASCAVMAKNGVLLHGSWYAPGILVSRP